jgi:hypothetical protein
MFVPAGGSDRTGPPAVPVGLSEPGKLKRVAPAPGAAD